MANSNFITNTSVFTPFTYEEIAAPLIQQTELQNQIDDAYSQLGANANAIASQLNPTSDRRAFELYSRYINDLKNQAAMLAANGLNNSSRSALNKLNARYGSDIIPIQKALEARAAEVKRYNDLADKDPTRMFSYDPSTESVDEYIADPTRSFKNASGAVLAQEVASQVAPIAKVLRGVIKSGNLDNYTRIWLEDRGLSIEEIQYAIDHPNDPGILQGIMERAVLSTGVDGWNNPEVSRLARYYAQQGVWVGLGQDEPHTYEDYGAKAALNYYYSRRSGSGGAGSEETGMPIQPWRYHVYSRTGGRRNDAVKSEMNALKDMFNNKTSIDNNVVEMLARKYGVDTSEIISPDGKFIKEGYNSLMDKMAKSAMMETEFELNLADYSIVADVVNKAVNIRISKGATSGLTELGKDKDSKLKDVTPYINKDMTLVFDPSSRTGFYLVGKDKDGNVKRFEMNPDLMSGYRPYIGNGQYELFNLFETARREYINLVNAGRYEEAKESIHNSGLMLYAAFNSLAPIQSRSSSKVLEY